MPCGRVRSSDRHREMSDGLSALDRVCNGGLRPGTLTVPEVTIPAQGRALTHTVARIAAVPRLLVVESVVQTTQWLLAGASGVPAELIRLATLSEADWERIVEHLPDLGHQELALTEARSVGGVAHVLCRRVRPMVIVEDLDTLGPAGLAAVELARLTKSSVVAVLAATTELRRPNRFEPENIERILVASHALGSRAALVSTDGPGGWITAQVGIEPLTASAWDLPAQP